MLVTLTHFFFRWPLFYGPENSVFSVKNGVLYTTADEQLVYDDGVPFQVIYIRDNMVKLVAYPAAKDCRPMYASVDEATQTLCLTSKYCADYCVWSLVPVSCDA